ncbi:MAG: hypothetical protein Q3962_04845 [Corynebacterium sp.]|nr:hypothetical protein [Corynebacterium sp.]
MAKIQKPKALRFATAVLTAVLLCAGLSAPQSQADALPSQVQTSSENVGSSVLTLTLVPMALSSAGNIVIGSALYNYLRTIIPTLPALPGSS